MRLKILERTILATMLVGVASAALPQIPVPPLPGLDVRITTGRPPALRYQRRGPRPGRDYVWVNGSWDWDGGRWRWIEGRWDHPLVADSYWIPARYIRTTRGYIYEPGHWSNQQVVVNDDIRTRREWRRHEREHEIEIQRERDRNRYRDQFRD